MKTGTQFSAIKRIALEGRCFAGSRITMASLALALALFVGCLGQASAQTSRIADPPGAAPATAAPPGSLEMLHTDPQAYGDAIETELSTGDFKEAADRIHLIPLTSSPKLAGLLLKVKKLLSKAPGQAEDWFPEKVEPTLQTHIKALQEALSGVTTNVLEAQNLAKQIADKQEELRTKKAYYAAQSARLMQERDRFAPLSLDSLERGAAAAASAPAGAGDYASSPRARVAGDNDWLSAPDDPDADKKDPALDSFREAYEKMHFVEATRLYVDARDKDPNAASVQAAGAKIRNVWVVFCGLALIVLTIFTKWIRGRFGG